MSRDWTPDELQVASAAMKEEGHMSYEEFCRELSRQAQPKRKLWGRVGITFSVTWDELHTLQDGGDSAKEFIFQKMRDGDYLLDGETYFPQTDSADHWKLHNDIEICL